jgi:DNA-binding CsgD family transcriptional regulator
MLEVLIEGMADGQGASNKESALALGMSAGTVKVHLHAVYEKLEVTSRNKLIVLLGAEH